MCVSEREDDLMLLYFAPRLYRCNFCILPISLFSPPHKKKHDEKQNKKQIQFSRLFCRFFYKTKKMSMITKEDGTVEIVPYDLDCAASTNLVRRLPAQRWGQRTRFVWQKTQSKALELDTGIKKCCFTQPAILPKCAAEVEPSLHQPQRLCGAASLGTPFYQRYGYYRKFGAGGKGARTAMYHNFPTGQMPQPTSVYGTGITRGP